MNTSVALRVATVIGFSKIVFDQFVSSAQEPRAPAVFAFLIALALVNASYEGADMGCSVVDCTMKNNRLARGQDSRDCEQRLCREGNRVNWRRAYLLAFLMFLILNIAYPESTLRNAMLMVCLFAFLYFYMNFDAYHRFSIWCR
jgi:hypothetical protein